MVASKSQEEFRIPSIETEESPRVAIKQESKEEDKITKS